MLEGQSTPQTWQGWRDLYDAWMVRKDYDVRLEGGESFNDIRRRFLPFMDEMINRSGESDAAALCISHGGLYLTMLPLVLRNIDAQTLQQHGFGYTSCLAAELHPDGLHCVEWDGEPFP